MPQCVNKYFKKLLLRGHTGSKLFCPDLATDYNAKDTLTFTNSNDIQFVTKYRDSSEDRGQLLRGNFEKLVKVVRTSVIWARTGILPEGRSRKIKVFEKVTSI